MSTSRSILVAFVARCMLTLMYRTDVSTYPLAMFFGSTIAFLWRRT